MAPQWEPGVQYNYDDVVEFEGYQYRIVQPHRSQSDWTPPITPALWGRLQGECREKQWGEDCKPCSPAPDCGQQQAQYTQHQAPPQQPPEEQEEEHHWYENPELKKKVELGGLLAGGAALAGLGFAAYKHHQHKGEEEAAHQWTVQRWATESQARTRAWREGRSPGPISWIWCEGKSIPRDAIQGGEQGGEALYICRAYHDKGLMVGKASRVLKKGAVIGYKKDEYHLDQYEVLVGDSRAVKWVSCAGNFRVEYLGARPVEGGREPDGTPIYIAQAPYKGGVHPGKACEIYGDGCFIPYDDSEKKVKEYAVLCYA